MNICFFACFPMIPYEGGVQRVTTTLSHELSRRGYGIVYLFFSAERKHKMNNPAIEYPQYYLDITSNDDELIKNNFRLFIRDHKIDVVINQVPDDQSCRLLPMVRDLVHVISVSHVVPFAESSFTRRIIWREFPCINFRLACYKAIALLSPRFYINHAIAKSRNLFYKTLNCSDKFVFLSERYFSRIFHYLPDFPKKKLVAINNPNTFDTDTSFDYNAKKNIVLWVGRVDTNKNCIDFVKAWRIFSKENPNWNAIVAGDGPELKKCKHWAHTHGINGITFLGYCENVAGLYSEAKIFVSTSFRESWGMSLTEAMSMGCVPCVYNTYETLVDIVDNGVDGILSNSTPEDLATKLELIVQDECLIKDLAAAGRRSVVRFSVAAICNQWEDLLNKTVKQKADE